MRRTPWVALPATLIRHIQSPDALAAPARNPVFIDVGPLAIPVFADYKDGMGCGILGRWVVAYHAYDLIVTVYIDSAHSRCGTSERTGIRLVKPHATALASGKQNLATAVGHDRLKELVPVPHGYRIDPVRTRARIRLKGSFLDYAALCGKDNIVVVDIFRILEVAHVDVCLDLVIRLYAYDVLQGSSLRGARAFRYLIYLEPVALAPRPCSGCGTRRGLYA